LRASFVASELCVQRRTFLASNAKTRTVGVGIWQVTMVAGAGFAEEPTIDIAA
jgi:hypothetical protein